MQKVKAIQTMLTSSRKSWHPFTHKTKKKDIFRFTLYWTLIFYTPVFLFCGLYAFWNYAFPPSPHVPSSPRIRDSYPLSTIVPNSAVPLIPSRKTPKPNERRSRVTFAIIVLMTFLILSVAGAVTGSAVLGFVTAGLYKAGNFNMSTCVYALPPYSLYIYICWWICLAGYLSCLLYCRLLLGFSGKRLWPWQLSLVTYSHTQNILFLLSVWSSIIEIIWTFASVLF